MSNTWEIDFENKMTLLFGGTLRTTGKGQGIGKSIYVIQTLQNQIYWLKMFFFLFLKTMACYIQNA